MAEPTSSARATQTGGLQQIRVGPKVGTLLLAVGGVGTTPPEHWTNSKGELWLGTLDAQSAPDIGLLSFPNRLAINGVLFERDIEQEGTSLLTELRRLVEDETVIRAPIVMVAHSLGGLVVKRAICLAKQSPRTFRNVIRRIAGFVFMGCPHSCSRDLEDWTGVENILQKFTKGRNNLLDPQCVQSLAVDCESFQLILAGDKKPVLTMSEKKGMSKQLIGKKHIVGLLADYRSFHEYEANKEQFVDTNSATIGHNQETVIEDNSNHRDLCMMSAGSATLDKIVGFLHLALDDTRRAIAKDSPRTNRPSVFDASTVRDQSSDEENILGVITESLSGQDLLRGAGRSILTPSEHASSTNRGSWTKDATAGSDKINPEALSALKDFTDFNTDQRDPILPCKYIPLPRDPVFSGREDTLASIRQELLASVQEIEDGSNSSLSEIIAPLNVYSLCGPGGMGKTSIANEFVHRYEKDFDAVFWVAADEETKLFNSFREIALKLGIISNADGKDLPAIREKLLAWLANPLRSYEHMDHVKPERASWLIVFDNVDRADTLEDFWPKDAAGSVLVTCRDPLIKSSIYLRNTGTIVPELLEEEGVALLLRLTHRESDEDDTKKAPEVVQALGRYPLAIAQMSGVILARDLGFNEFLALYSEETERREMLGISEGQSASLRRYNQTLGTVWALDDLKDGRALLEAISFLDPDSIPETLLENNPACKDWNRYPQTSLEYSKARAELLSRSLIYRNRGKKTLRIHRLIQDTVRTQMDDATFTEVYSRVLDMIGARWPRVFKGFGNVQTDWQRNSELWAHILSLFKYRDRFDPTTANLAVSIKRMNFALDVLMFSIVDSRFSASPTMLIFYGFLRGSIHQNEPNFELQMMDIFFLYCRGELGLHTNDREYPLPDFAKCVEQLDSLLDDDAKKADSFFGAAVNELGCAYLMNWNEEDGLVQFERSATILQNLKHPSAQETSMAQINVGFVYGYLGRYDEALEIFKAALRDRHRELGQDDYSSFVNGKLYMGWGNVLAAQGRLDDSFKFHVKCLEHYKRSVGNFHHRTGDGCVKASDHFARTGDDPTALALLDQALKIFKLDPYHKPEAARAHYKKGNVLRKMEQEEEAEKEMDTALEIFNSIVPLEDRVGSIDKLDDEDFDHWIMFWSR
ncbi:tetratricopeptide repeat domain-containing protein [Penicillium paradoxum]|uniref:tetratricopeptide repeat domain-containing protein n=1 Tax=Penicillium paradoxum TaxID=176176 RepID=UPI002546AD9F|nr:tetratricopeptide repeat domain-containing protein [Penicillium paradoxum]KAJ5794326.1 tetratricopeptide repeat domain-containing protein [Penicillium paradoxum]